jgi:hypothetical protein
VCNSMCMKKCTHCKIEKTEDSFGKNGNYRHSWCIECRRQVAINKRRQDGIVATPIPIIIDDEHKQCLRCKEIHHIDNFNKNNRGRLKRSSYCKKCNSEYHKELRNTDIEKYRAKTKESTQRHRDKHREHWRQLHRMNQFKRRNLMDAKSDGTITEEFMKKLYNTEICYWCKKSIPIDQRTAEHIIPLKLGGVHGVSNLTMACLSCNSSKLNF